MDLLRRSLCYMHEPTRLHSVCQGDDHALLTKSSMYATSSCTVESGTALYKLALTPVMSALRFDPKANEVTDATSRVTD